MSKTNGNEARRLLQEKTRGRMMNRKELLTLLTSTFALALAAAVFSSCVVVTDKGETTSREQAVKTVASFLEMCKEGQLAEAAEKYIDSEKDYIHVLPISMDNIISYTVDSDASAIGHWEGIPPARLVLAEVQIGDAVSVELVFSCSEDGKRILLVGISEKDVTLPPLLDD